MIHNFQPGDLCRTRVRNLTLWDAPIGIGVPVSTLGPRDFFYVVEASELWYVRVITPVGIGYVDIQSTELVSHDCLGPRRLI